MNRGKIAICVGFLVILNQNARALSSQDDSYFRKLAQDTYQSILFLVEDKTSLPYDSSRFNRPDTSVSNIGLYLAALVGAQQLGIEKRDVAVARARKALNSLEKMNSWNGFTPCWNNVIELTPSAQDPWISVLDTGNLAAGLILIAEEFQPLRQQANNLLNQILWGAVYNDQQKLLYGGYNLQKREWNEQWLLSQLGTDARLAYVVAIGQNHIPVESWDKLSRQNEVKYSLKYLAPGWQGGGLFMQFLSGLFMDEAGTVMGQSAANMAFAQIIHAQVIESPVWGWSACELPNGQYMGSNRIEDNFVTPHASALAIDYFPDVVRDNFKNLESLGARAPFVHDGRSWDYGFRDSVHIRTRAADPHFLLFDQSMLFLALANHLTDGKVRNIFQRHPVIQAAISRISDYQVNSQDRNAFFKSLPLLGVDQIILMTGPLYVQNNSSGQKIIKKDIHVINYTPHDFRKNRLMWQVLREDTDEVVNAGDIMVDLKTRTALKPDSAWIAVPRQTDANAIYYLEAKLVNEKGTVVSNYCDVFPLHE